MTLDEFLNRRRTQPWLAARVGVSQSAVSQWLRDGVSAERVPAIVAATEGEVTAHDLRPDLYPAGFEFPPDMLPEPKVVAAGG